MPDRRAVCRPPGCISRPDVGSSDAGRRRPTLPEGEVITSATRLLRGIFFASRQERGCASFLKKITLRFAHAFGARALREKCFSGVHAAGKTIRFISPPAHPAYSRRACRAPFLLGEAGGEKEPAGSEITWDARTCGKYIQKLFHFLLLFCLLCGKIGSLAVT